MEQLSLFQPLDRTARQKEGIKEWIKHKCCGSLVWCTGVGKTHAAIMAIKILVAKMPELKVLIVVPTEGLQSQWQAQIFENQLTFNCEVLIINTAIKRERVCDFLIIDELHRAAAESFSKIFQVVKYKYILGLTATMERLDGKHELFNKYCPEVDRITTSEAIMNGWLAENVEYKVVLDVDDIDVYKNYTREFNEHFEFFHYNFELAMSMLGKDGYKRRLAYRDELCKANSRMDKSDVLKLVTYHATGLARVLQARKKFINEHPKKLELTREIIKHRPNSKIITFSATIDIAEKIGVGKVYSSKDTKKKGRMTLDEFKTADAAILNTSKRADEG